MRRHLRVRKIQVVAHNRNRDRYRRGRRRIILADGNPESSNGCLHQRHRPAGVRKRPEHGRLFRIVARNRCLSQHPFRRRVRQHRDRVLAGRDIQSDIAHGLYIAPNREREQRRIRVEEPLAGPGPAKSSPTRRARFSNRHRRPSEHRAASVSDLHRVATLPPSSTPPFPISSTARLIPVMVRSNRCWSCGRPGTPAPVTS